MQADVAVIGGGPAGLAAALEAAEHADDVVLLERDGELGGILPQCIHHGFGNFIFGERWTGPEYAQHYVDRVHASVIDVLTDTMVLDIAADKTITAVTPHRGVFTVKAKAIVLAMGCRERTRSQIRLPGPRPAGIYTAGTAQRLINIEGTMPGSRAVILGSGDVGLIMARRLTWEGATVEGVYEIMPHPGGLTRNVVQCLHDHDIPLHLGHTVTDIHGTRRVEAVTVARVDEDMQPIPGTERNIPCDTLILAVGLIPENELSRDAGISLDPATGGPAVDQHMETTQPGIYACGNVVHVHDVVDDVTIAAQTAGHHAARAAGDPQPGHAAPVQPGRNVSYVVPQRVTAADTDVRFYLRVQRERRNAAVMVHGDGDLLHEQRERVVRPPEMVTLTVPAEKLQHVKNINVEVHDG
jgi:NADPH-dependent 2,4-dienoyl-CoA reductase/sulfur reductase-like enzyme